MKKRIYRTLALLFAILMLPTSVVNVNAASATSKKLSKVICTSTLTGQSSFTSHTGTAYSTISKQSYTTVTSTYTYVNSSNKVKTVNSDYTGGGGSTTATWSYSIMGSCFSSKVKSKHYAKVNGCSDSFYTTAA